MNRFTTIFAAFALAACAWLQASEDTDPHGPVVPNEAGGYQAGHGAAACCPRDPVVPNEAGGYSVLVYRNDGVSAREAATTPYKGLHPAVAKARGVSTKGGGSTEFRTGLMKVLMIRVRYPDDQRDYMGNGEAEAYRVARDVSDYYVENSYGSVHLSFDVTPLLDMPQTFMHYRETVRHVSVDQTVPIFSDGVNAAVTAGWTGNYDIYVVLTRPCGAPSISLVLINGGVGQQVLAHEIGHVLGFGHSTRWFGDGLSSMGARDWRRFKDYSRQPEKPEPTKQYWDYPIGDIYETNIDAYGDPWCVMGGGLSAPARTWNPPGGFPGHFSLPMKLGRWIGSAYYEVVKGSGRYRVTAFDYPNLETGRIYGLRVPRNLKMDLILGYRCRQVDGRDVPFKQVQEPWMPNSLLVWGSAWDSSREQNTPPTPRPHLIDTTPGSACGRMANGPNQTGPSGEQTKAAVWLNDGQVKPPVDPDYMGDCGITVGRTWSDWENEIHITVVDKVMTEPQALDVVVNRGPFPTNRLPRIRSLTVTNPSLVGKSGQVMLAKPTDPAATLTQWVTFQVDAADEDGDTLAYWWDFGDLLNASDNAPTCSHAWNKADYGNGKLFVVRCTVSDMKGGVASMSIPVNVGLPEFAALDINDTTGRHTFWAKGHIRDQAGKPLQGIRVAMIDTPYVGGYTDSDGSFLVANVPNSPVSFEALGKGYRCIGVNGAKTLPSTITFYRDLDDIDFVAWKRQTVAVESAPAQVAVGNRASWTITRTTPGFGLFDTPAEYEQKLDLLNGTHFNTFGPTTGGNAGAGTYKVPVRLYTNAGALEWRNKGATAWQSVASYTDLLFRTPERPEQWRSETTIHPTPTCANPDHDLYVVFAPGVTEIEVRSVSAINVMGNVALLAAFGVDYEIADGKAEGTVQIGTASAVGQVVAAIPTTATLGTAAGSTVPISVSIDRATTTALSISLQVIEGETYISGVPASVVIPAGSTTVTFTVARTAAPLGTEEQPTSIIELQAGPGYDRNLTQSQCMVVFSDNANSPASVKAAEAATPTSKAAGDIVSIVPSGFISEAGSQDARVFVRLRAPASERIVVPLSVTTGAEWIANVPAEVVFDIGEFATSFVVSFAGTRSTGGSVQTATIAIQAGARYTVDTTRQQCLISVYPHTTPLVWITNIAGPARELNEAGTAGVSARFAVSRSGRIDTELRVTLAYGGTAVSGTNYQPLPTVITIPAGFPSATFNLVPIAAGSAGGDKTFTATIEPKLDYRLANPVQATTEIQNARLPDVGIAFVSGTNEVSTGTLNENGAALTLRITRYRELGSILPVYLDLSGTAEYGTEWQFGSVTELKAINDLQMPIAGITKRAKIDMPAGRATVNLTVQASDDLIRQMKQESDRYIIIHTAKNSAYNVLRAKDNVMATLIDDESRDNAPPKPSVSVEFASRRVREGASFPIDIVLSDWPGRLETSTNGGVQSVDWELVPDATGVHPAVPGVNFMPTTTTQTAEFIFSDRFNQMERRVHLNIDTLRDGVASPELTFLLRLKNPKNCTLPQINTGSSNLAECKITIIDCDATEVSIAATAPMTSFGGSPAKFTLSRTGDTAKALIVPVNVYGTAVPYQHYQQFGDDRTRDGDASQNRLVTIPAGSASVEIPIVPLADRSFQGSVSLTAIPVDADGYDAVGSSATVTITSTAADVRPQVSMTADGDDASAFEDGDNGKPGRVTLTRTGDLTGMLTVQIARSTLSTAIDADLRSVMPTSVTFAPGAATTSFLVPAYDDTDPILKPEDTETVIFGIVAASDTSYTVGSRAGATVWIVNNDGPLPVLWAETEVASINESNGTTGLPGKIVLYRTKESRGPLVVSGASWGGNATKDADYFLRVDGVVTNTIAFAAGVETVTVEVVPSNDSLAEGVEIAVLQLGAGAGYSVDPEKASATVSIIDDEAATVTIARVQNGAEAGSVPVGFLLTRISSNVSASVAIQVALSSSRTPGATIGTDTTGPSVVTATFPANVATVAVNVGVVNDVLNEADEWLTGSVVANGTTVIAWVPTVTNSLDDLVSADAQILDDDLPRVSITRVGPEDALERNQANAGAVLPTTMRVTRVAQSMTAALEVLYTVSGTAAMGADFVGLTGTATIPAGQASVDIVITPVDDLASEPVETVVLDLTANSTYNQGTSQAQANIISDDVVRIAILGPVNYQVPTTLGGSFCEPLTLRLYRLGSLVGPLRVQFVIEDDGDASTEDITTADLVTVPVGELSGRTDVLAGTVDFADGQSTTDLAVKFAATYAANVRRMFTVRIDTPLISGTYVPGDVPGVNNGMEKSTIRILKATETSRLVKLSLVDSLAAEGNENTALLRVIANKVGTGSTAITVAQNPILSTAVGPGTLASGADYDLSAAQFTVPAGQVSGDLTFTAFRDFNTAEGDEFSMLQLPQPVLGTGDPAYWVVNLPPTVKILDSVVPSPVMVAIRNGTFYTDGSSDVIPGLLAYGTTTVNSYELKNSGYLPLTISSAGLTWTNMTAAAIAYGDASFPVTAKRLNPGEMMTMVVPITPVASGAFSVVFNFATNETTSPFTFTIRGNAAQNAQAPGTQPAYNGTANSGGCGAGGFAGLLLGVGLMLGLRRRRR